MGLSHRLKIAASHFLRKGLEDQFALSKDAVQEYFVLNTTIAERAMSESPETSRLEDHLLRQLPAETVKFFATFSRFEYALKKAGILRTNKVEPYPAEPAWWTFGAKLGAPFLEQIRKSGNADTILGKPPQRQMVVGRKCNGRTASRSPRS